MLVIRCKNCGKQLEAHPVQTRSCGCENITSIRGTNISGKNLSLVEIITNNSKTGTKVSNTLTHQDLSFQEERKKRNFKRLDFEIK